VGGIKVNNELTIDDVLDIIEQMKESNDFHNPTLDELEQRLM
jgi:hypothetical protein